MVAGCQELGSALAAKQALREKVLLNLIFFLSLQRSSLPQLPEIALPPNDTYAEETIALMRLI
ncbi:MAG: hypothetical protein ICV61_11375 [Microcoleus sp. Co-bin12]|nr:hypothetical protein [Microcoleus sp. Co-bin12]